MNEHLQKLIDEMKTSSDLVWTTIRDRLHEEHQRATTSEERATCLALFTGMMDAVARQLEPDALAKFKEARRKDYSTFIVRESTTGTEVDIAKLNVVTAREIVAGRMAPNHQLRIVAIFGAFGVAALFDEHPGLFEALTETP